MSPVGVPGGGHRRRACPSSSSAPGTTSPTGPRCWRTGTRKIRRDDRRARGDRLRAAARPGARWSDITGGGRARPASHAHRELQPRDRARLRGLPVPLRVPEPRLRRLPGLLRLLQGGVPGDLRPGHREDGAGHRGRPVPARRRAARSSRELAVELDVADALAAAASTRRSRPWPPRRAARSGSPPGRRAKDPWFNFSSGNGLYSDDKVWLDHPEIPLGFLRDYVRARAGRARTSRGRPRRSPPSATASPREYRALLPDDEARAAFDEKLGPLAAGVPVRREPQLLHRALVAVAVLAQDPRARPGARRRGLLGRRRRHLLRCAATSSSRCSSTTATAGPSGAEPIGPYHWPAEIARRKAIVAALATKAPAAGDERAARGGHRAVHDHALRHHDRAAWAWLSGSDASDELTGMAASPGTAEGIGARGAGRGRSRRRSRRARSSSRRITAPSWGPVFGRIAAVGHRHRRHDEPRGDRLPRVRAAGRDGHGLRDDSDPRPASASASTATAAP